jgi:hypothetical protein
MQVDPLKESMSSFRSRFGSIVNITAFIMLTLPSSRSSYR